MRHPRRVHVSDGFLLQLDAAGSYANAWQFSGPDYESVYVDGTAGGLVYAAGSFGSTMAFSGGGTLTSGGGSDAFVLALDPGAPPPPAPPPVVSATGGSVVERHSGRVALTFTVSLSWASEQPVTVYYKTLNGSAAAGSDYEYQEGVLTFAPGETVKTVTVWVIGDKAVESDETFTLALFAAPDWATEIGRATGTITNDDTKRRN
jgi:Calx-beta domain